MILGLVLHRICDGNKKGYFPLLTLYSSLTVYL